MARRGAGPGAEPRKLLPRLEPARSGRGGAGIGWGGAGALPRVGETQMSEDSANDARIVDGGDQAHAAPTRGHASTSIAKARCMRAAQFQYRGVVFGSVPSGPGSRGAARPADAADSGTSRP